jgi:peptidoglycan/xylan/chitin deacetylase (PgdA/CDA1 family)
MYHIIDRPLSDQEARYCCAPDLFEKHMRHLATSGCAIGLDDFCRALSAERDLPSDAVAVTFDDGFAATFEHALPVLERYRVPATMFVVSGRVGGYNDWMMPRGFPQRALMSARQILDMRDAGVNIGSHTRTHPRLPGMTREELTEEISGSRNDLQTLLAQDVSDFAYPFGAYDDTARHMVQAAGYQTACSTRAGFNNTDARCYELRRMEVYGWDLMWRFRQKLKYGRNESSLTFPLTYYASRARAYLGL